MTVKLLAGCCTGFLVLSKIVFQLYNKQLYIFTVNKNTQVDASPALYNLKDDIGETKNRVNEYPEVAQKLSQALEDHLSRLNIKK